MTPKFTLRSVLLLLGQTSSLKYVYMKKLQLYHKGIENELNWNVRYLTVVTYCHNTASEKLMSLITITYSVFQKIKQGGLIK